MNLELRCTKRRKKCVRFKRLILVMKKTSLSCLEQGWGFNFELSHVLSILMTMSPGTLLFPTPDPTFIHYWNCTSLNWRLFTCKTLSNPLHLCVFISGYWQFLQLLVKLWSSLRSLLPPMFSHILRVSMLGDEKAVSSLLLLSYSFYCLPHPLDLISPLCLRHSLILILGPFITNLSNAREFCVKEFPLLHHLLLQKTTKCEPVERREHSKSEQSKSSPECELQEVLINLP